MSHPTWSSRLRLIIPLHSLNFLFRRGHSIFYLFLAVLPSRLLWRATMHVIERYQYHWPLALMEASTCMSHLSLILGIDWMLPLPAFLPMPLTGHFHYIGRLIMLTWGKFVWQDWSCWTDNCGLNATWQFTRLHVFSYSNYTPITRLLFAKKWLHSCGV